MRINYDNLLANLDPKKPFQRETLRIRNRTGSMFMFSVGTRQFIAIIEGKQMRISGDGLVDTETLIKQAR